LASVVMVVDVLDPDDDHPASGHMRLHPRPVLI